MRHLKYLIVGSILLFTSPLWIFFLLGYVIGRVCLEKPAPAWRSYD